MEAAEYLFLLFASRTESPFSPAIFCKLNTQQPGPLSKGEKMKNSWWILAILTPLTCFPLLGQQSGCAAYFNVNMVVCGNGGSCTFQTPYGNFYTSSHGYTCTNISCCGVGSYPNCYFDGWPCWRVKLEDPNVKQQLIELAKVQEILVVSCKENYQPLEVVLTQQPAEIRLPRRDPSLLGKGGE
jgi:hypothetical protein